MTVGASFKKLKRRSSRALLLGKKSLLHRLVGQAGGGASRRYLFVGGVQRSGTNMLMDVLERSYETDVYHERDPRAFDGYQMRSPQFQ